MEIEYGKGASNHLMVEPFAAFIDNPEDFKTSSQIVKLSILSRMPHLVF